nr:Chain A, RR11 peptide from Cysteine Deleted Protegrin-1 [unidentified]
RLYRRRFVVGR